MTGVNARGWWEELITRSVTKVGQKIVALSRHKKQHNHNTPSQTFSILTSDCVLSPGTSIPHQCAQYLPDNIIRVSIHHKRHLFPNKSSVSYPRSSCTVVENITSDSQCVNHTKQEPCLLQQIVNKYTLQQIMNNSYSYKP